MMSDKIGKDASLRRLSIGLGTRLIQGGWKIAVAESCTGGWISRVITGIPGSSQWFDLGLVTYSNLAKEENLGIAKALINNHGAVSEQVAIAMVTGVVALAKADIGISVTGIAGPDGGTPEKPIGTVCLGFLLPGGGVQVETNRFLGDRKKVRKEAVRRALSGIISRLP